MKILLTGATGLIGTRLAARLFRAGHDLTVISRDPERARKEFPVPAAWVSWDLGAGSPPGGSGWSEACNAGIDAVIHLAGDPVAQGPWNEERKRRILESREIGTRNLFTALGNWSRLPSTVVSASAIGYYGDRPGGEELMEASGPGTGFLSEVCRRWEAESLRPLGSVRQVALRIGIVLDPAGGAVGELVPLFRKGMGGPAGGGRQWMSWIHLEDLLSLVEHALVTPSLSGAVNAVSPGPVTNRDFGRALGAVLERPSSLPAPAFALRLALGERATLVLASQRVAPRAALASGFSFRFPELGAALTDLLRVDPDDPATELFSAVQWVPRPVDEVFAFFSEARNLEELTPPFLHFKILGQSTPGIEKGTLIDYRLNVHGVPLRWRTRIDLWEPPSRFVDLQLKGPYSLWHHTHGFESLRGGTWMTDRVLFRLPAGWWGELVAGAKVRSDVSEIFAYRRAQIARRFGDCRSSEQLTKA